MSTTDLAEDPFWTDDPLRAPRPEGGNVYGTNEGYYEWLNRGRKLCESHSNNQWNVGDWLTEGEVTFDFKQVVGDIPRHMMICAARTGDDGEIEHRAIKVPNFWKDAAAETGTTTATLRHLAKVSRAYRKEDRFAQLSFTHHAIAQPYDRRLEYLRACLDGLEPGQRPRSIAWLYAYIEQREGKKEVKEDELASHIIQFNVNNELHRKLKQASRYYRMSIQELVQAKCTDAVIALLSELEEKISLEKYGWYEQGKWPFYVPSEANRRLDALAKKPKSSKPNKRQKPRWGLNPVGREIQRQVAINRWSREGRTRAE